ncbi:MAG TPA: hypothetical protein VEU62_19905, partial [Bryobacterales bacterium]|nr:hypothetical protein [Bryobacterales bacterium]
MTYFNTRRRGRRVAVLLSVWLASGCWTTAPAWGGHKGNAQYKQARKAELSGDLDKAYELYQAALKAEPEDQTYMLAVRRVRFLDGQSHVDKGHKLADQGKLAEAALEFEKALTIDPSLAIAAEDLRRTQELIARSKEKKKPGTAEAVTKAAEPTGLSPLLAAKKETEQLLEEAQPVPTLRPISTQRINLKASNNSKVIFETIGKLAGINVLFDPEMQGRRVTIELNNATLHESLEYTAAIAKAFWKPLSSNAIFITDDNTQKRREYEDYVVKTFYLTNAYTAQELQEIATAVRSVTEIRRVYTVNSLNALVIRGTTDQVALAEKIIDDVDKSRAEVIVDVLVLETSHTKTREFGLVPVSGGTPGIDVPIGINPLNPAAGSTGTPTTTPSTTPTTTPTTTPITTPSTTPSTPSTGAGGSYVFGKTNILNFAMNIPNAELKALLSTSNTRVLQSPRIRGFDGYKAQLRIGSRIPIATGSFQPGIGGVGINPLVNTQFNYQDVGVVMDMLPRVHYGKEVSMHVELEISNVVDHVDIGGISQPVIGQRKIIHDIRLKEGEASIIGGLNQTQTSKTLTGIPGLSQIPLLGHLFSNQKLDISDSEILLVLIPHVVRVPDITDLNLRAVSAGSDTTVKLNFAEPDDDSPALPPV